MEELARTTPVYPPTRHYCIHELMNNIIINGRLFKTILYIECKKNSRLT